MNCNCNRNLVETANNNKDAIGDKHIVYICENCKRYYIEGTEYYYEVTHDTNDNWTNTGEKIEKYCNVDGSYCNNNFDCSNCSTAAYYSDPQQCFE